MSGPAKVFTLILIVLIGGSFWFSFRRNPQARALEARAVATRVLAEELARRYPGTKAVVLSNPFAQSAGIRKQIKAVEEAGLRGLKEGFGSKISLDGIVFPDIRAEARENPRSVKIPETSTPLSYLMAEDAFDRAAAKYPQCETIVSLIGLPAALDRVELWKKEGPPRVAFLFPDLRILGDAAALKKAMAVEKIAAFVLRRTDGVLDQVAVKDDYKKEFERRFLLVTPENVEALLKSHALAFEFQPGVPAPK